ncbi:2-dehydro-3-deoxygalactonokinase [Buttiauxella noackiae ATCC 51607]|uniref:2-dehydro-3-deoxygalactonokinase n=1 Tax=Buttiauxella noackiae ATCC 51607 TaxID=1354255 RepID=A0A1B7HKT1_9ENTR|nr:2-dehydro-3-deoxygalactonokinase [Buttiauxella noackiae]OAT16244.1 2-dehydro-3-deoxygalactonokinase [Buttiauxella noackiae ATCC 51607]
MKTHWIAIDWGTTNFRAFLMQGSKQVSRISQPCGLLSVEKDQFAPTLQNLLQTWLEQYGNLPIVMAGMVGSQQGWHEVPYAPLPCNAQDLASRTLAFTTPWGSQAWLIPGANGTSQFGQPDVMRGEEVQLFGLSALHPADEHFVLLPGTHSKHAQLRLGEITASSTFMTGEIFSLLSQHSILGRALPEQQEDNEAFLLGVRTAIQGAPFTHLIFSARTRRLAGEIKEASVHSYLSGLTIGYELQALPAALHAWLVGSPSLTARYELAASLMDLNFSPANGDDCFIHGLWHLFTQLQGNRS